MNEGMTTMEPYLVEKCSLQDLIFTLNSNDKFDMKLKGKYSSRVYIFIYYCKALLYCKHFEC